MKKSRTTIVSLTGGLGNQLFQLAAGLYAAQGEKLSLEWTIGRPRLNVIGVAEISSFHLPENVSLEKRRKNNWLASKSTGYMLRMSFEPKKIEKTFGFFSIARGLASIVTSIYFKKLSILYPGRNVGYYSLRRRAKGNYLVGYFQSYKWADEPEVFERLMKLKIAHESTELSKMRNLAEIEKPLIVHIRLGDYKHEDTFGILPSAYYENAIRKLWGLGKYKKIWAFSDEPDLAKSVLSFLPSSHVRWISEIDNSASMTLEVMRYGQGYVIGNSTFSWWGAFLSYSQNIEVIAPKPWFRNYPAPQELIPPRWNSEVSW